MERIYNFSAGPSMLPLPVLERAGRNITNFGDSGMSVMEMSHRSSAFVSIFEDTKAKLKATMAIPDDYDILFLQGGASTQFAMVPMNLLGGKSADYAVTGNFSGIAYKEAKKLGNVNLAATGEAGNFSAIPAQEELTPDPGAAYFHYCANNTIYGTAWKYIPDTGSVPLVSDMSSCILSAPVDVSKFGLIYAGAQKNMAPAGVTVVIIRRDLLERSDKNLPNMFSYKTQAEKDSMYNTPPCWCIYMLGLVLDWVAEQGGLAGMQKINEAKAAMLYDTLESTKKFSLQAAKADRSMMNVTFRTDSADLDKAFVKAAAAEGLCTLAGHRNVGGMRASIYNAMPAEGVEKLCKFIKEFDAAN